MVLKLGLVCGTGMPSALFHQGANNISVHNTFYSGKSDSPQSLVSNTTCLQTGTAVPPLSIAAAAALPPSITGDASGQGVVFVPSSHQSSVNLPPLPAPTLQQQQTHCVSSSEVSQVSSIHPRNPQITNMRGSTSESNGTSRKFFPLRTPSFLQLSGFD